MIPPKTRRACIRGVFLIRAVLACQLLWNPSPAFSEGSNYFFDVHQTDNGPDLSSITAIVQSLDGYLWLGTYNGLVRFDGIRFVVFDSHNTPGLGDNRISALFEDDDGVLWIGHESGGLTRFSDGNFKQVNLGSVWPGGTVSAISMDDKENLWLLNNTGSLLRLRDGRLLSSGTVETNSTVTWIARKPGRNGKLWMVAGGLMGTVKDGKFAPSRLNDTGQSTVVYEKVLPSRDGGLWVLRQNHIQKWRDGKWVVDLGQWNEKIATTLLETRSGSLLVGTLKNGFYLFKPGAEPLHFTRTNGLSYNWVRSFCEDREGNVWIGTGGGGLDTMRAGTVKMLNAPDGWQGRTVLSFITSEDGSAWIGTEGAGLYYYHEGEWSCFNESNGLTSPFVWSVLKTRQNDLFVGTWGGGLFFKNGEHFESHGDLRKITAPVVALYEGRKGEIWIGTTIGLYCYETGRLTWFAGKKKLAVPDVRAITESPDGALWFGMNGGGLGCLRDGNLKQFRKPDGLNSDFIFSLYADQDGTLWMGTSDNGLCRLKHGKFIAIGVEQGLLNNAIYQIVDDGAGGLWLGSQHGILYVSKADLNKCADGMEKSIHCISYGRGEGLASERCLSGFQPNACRAADGRLWFPTAKGIAIVDPARLATNSFSPPVIIEEFFVDGQQIQPPVAQTGAIVTNSQSMLKIQPGKRRFEFRYTGLSFAAPDKVRFKCKLTGLEDNWVDVGANRVAQYSYLAPGTYVFHVIACNNHDVWNEIGASLAFSVLPYFWQTLWFRVISIVVGAISVGVVVLWVTRHRMRRQLERLERQHAVEGERSRIARDMHDDLGANLTRITMLSQTMRRQVAGNPEMMMMIAGQIGNTAIELTRAMDEIVWAVSHKHDTLDSLATYLGGYAQTYLDTAGIRCYLDIPISLPNWTLTAETRHNLFLAFKEALHNVVKHAKASEVQISLELTPNGFILVIADDGCGLDLNDSISGTVPSMQGTRLTGGNGLPNMQKRLEKVGGCCEWSSAPGQGTRVKLIVTLKP